MLVGMKIIDVSVHNMYELPLRGVKSHLIKHFHQEQLIFLYVTRSWHATLASLAFITHPPLYLAAYLLYLCKITLTSSTCVFRSSDSENGSLIVKVRGLPWSTTIEEIIDFFKGCTIANGREGVFIVMTKEGRPSGEAFVEMETEDDMEKALKRDREYVGTRYIEGSLESKKLYK